MRTHDQDAELRASAIRALLASPLVLRSRDEDMFRNVAGQRGFLQSWFEDNLGWLLHVDVRAGIARLHKRTSRPDARRGICSTRASSRPFDAFRYQLLALICAELLRRPHVTLGDLTDAIARICSTDQDLRTLDIGRHSHRLALVDALLWLIDVGAVDVTAGEVDEFGRSREIDAVLVADTTLIPMLLSSDVPPSRVGAGDPAGWLEGLLKEPRYGDPQNMDRDQRVRRSRHEAIRILLDDPVLDMQDLPPDVRDYLSTPSGRDKARSAAQEAGLEVERHGDAWLAIDGTRESTPVTFSSTGRSSTAQQASAILLALMVHADGDGRRHPERRSMTSLRRELLDHMRDTPGWARTYRSGDGVDTLLEESLRLLEEFGLIRREGAEVVPRPAAGRYAVHVVADPDAKREKES